MKFLITRINTSSKNFLRVCGYKEITNPHKVNEISYARSLEASRFYPRFHIYIHNLPDQQLEINLHLDMKKPSYAGTTAHSGEYDGDLISREMQRIVNISERFHSPKDEHHQPLGFKKERSLRQKIKKLFGF